ncbi:MAG: AAA family ATPase [Candidatus Omnitrophica bacterium]|jgi:general secretion pathway protein A|nr:AAA family ATPase [Candidatus Omnitrophota bacterium]
MSYYEALNLKSEPFSTSPDPYFFYPSSSHDSALKRLEIAIRLRRGLNVILGDVGTGKTTLSRMLIQLFKDEPDFIFHMILDPSYKTEFQFLSSLAKMFGVNPAFRSTLDYKDALEKYLFQKGVDEKKTIVLLIDEGQKLTPSQVEILRTLLNYETNEFKLLQLVILSQIELLPKIRRIRNFMDRINLKYIINPLDESETRALIHFRLKQAGYDASGQELFTDSAIRHIYEYTQGYPRKISMFCHDALEVLIMRNKKFVDQDIIEEIMTREVR